ncbi:MAG: Lrp/AsnC ligand binding domain-containing protein [Aurantimonas coralicida]|jgi:DNA-binding Lrp family transcriptional regulator|uniref:AsnC family transcriptional regulator n=3 Tax=Aurantimonas TaxID=182269 RepID=A0A0P0Z091_9HYPH|nr:MULTISPECIES: Lrp/AsnC ligand binding domain-containing protein [Aurantimonas]MAY30194.1 AsnC family transcriptional regulator [Aurantimonas sp.]EAS50368.1 putative AnsC family transcriptional regulator [Aurantimonas manganoxydans SI85-9A1]MAY30901.1 AsnC family transcriptional regulator [Aurantimonas sp.]MBC6714975.1 Lrp/AsnC ligand binding domain-containing protein [Aurantimonas sp. DM33-3]MCC4299185.1 Lrp/AsnC ligand binding domain-containing protein [Aurantimonas coralicida]
MQTIFVQFKCRPGAAYTVANDLQESVEEMSEVYSTSGHYDLIAKFYLDDGRDLGHFVTEKLQVLDGVADTFTTVAFKAFGSAG